MNDQLTACYSNLSELYLENFPDSAYFFAQKALQAQQKSKIEHSMTTVYFAFFQYYDRIKNNDSAAYYINKSIQIAEQYNQIKSVVIYYSQAGDYYFRIKDFDKAMFYHKKAELLSRKLEIPSLFVNSLKHIGDIYYNQNQLDSSAYYYNEFIKNDTLKTIEKVQRDVLKLSELRIREQTEFKLKEAKSKRQILIYSLTGSLLLIISLFVLLRKIVNGGTIAARKYPRNRDRPS